MVVTNNSSLNENNNPKRVRQPPGGNSNDIFGTQTPPLNTRLTPLFKSKSKSIHLSQDTQDRLFGSEKTSTTRKVKDYLKSSIFNDDNTTYTPVKPSTRKELSRNPITGLVIKSKKDQISEILVDNQDGSSIESGNVSGNVSEDGNGDGLDVVSAINELEIPETSEQSEIDDKKSKQFSSNISEAVSESESGDSGACDTSINYIEAKSEIDVNKESIKDLQNASSKILDINDGVKDVIAEKEDKIDGHKIDKCNTSKDIDSNELSKKLNESLSIENSKCDHNKSTSESTSENGTPNNKALKTPTIVRVRQPPGGRSLGIF